MRIAALAGSTLPSSSRRRYPRRSSSVSRSRTSWLRAACHYSGETRRGRAINAQLLIGLGFVGSAFFAGYIALLVHSHPGVPGQQFDRVVGSTWRIVGASLVAFICSETVDNLVGAPLRGRVHDGIRVVASAGASAPIDSAIFLVLVGRRFLPAKAGDIVPA